MDEGPRVLVLFLGLALITAVTSHVTIKHYLKASLAGAIVATAVFLTIATVKQGFIDPLAPIAFVYGGIYAFGIQLLVGLPFVPRNRRHKAKQRGQCSKCGYDLPGSTECCPECSTLIEP